MTVKVKPLEWTMTPPIGMEGAEKGDQWAIGVGGIYHITSGPTLWRVDDPFTFIECDSIQDCKAWTEADHVFRVLNLLEG